MNGELSCWLDKWNSHISSITIELDEFIREQVNNGSILNNYNLIYLLYHYY